MSKVDDLKNEIANIEDDIYSFQISLDRAEEEVYYYSRELSDAKDKLEYLNSQLETELNDKEDEDE